MYQGSEVFPLIRARVVIPCFNEERRLDRARMLTFARDPGVELLFVDDGSRDGTLGVLHELRDASEGKIDVLPMPRNGGKGAAVRAGMLEAIRRGDAIVGYADADLSTPPEELLKLLRSFETPGVEAVIGARVMLIGRRIQRKRSRHYLGRIFASMTETILRLPFYDTQCGAKFFRTAPLLRWALETPFVSRWAFDVELIGRLLVGTPGIDPLLPGQLIEVPLDEWVDVDGSKLDMGGMAKTLVDLARIELEMERLRKAKRGGS